MTCSSHTDLHSRNLGSSSVTSSTIWRPLFPSLGSPFFIPSTSLSTSFPASNSSITNATTLSNTSVPSFSPSFTPATTLSIISAPLTLLPTSSFLASQLSFRASASTSISSSCPPSNSSSLTKGIPAHNTRSSPVSFTTGTITVALSSPHPQCTLVT